MLCGQENSLVDDAAGVPTACRGVRCRVEKVSEKMKHVTFSPPTSNEKMIRSPHHQVKEFQNLDYKKYQTTRLLGISYMLAT